jgi:hypothetical protein
MSQAGAEELEVIGADAPSIHPQAHGFIADELRREDGLVDRRSLGAGEAELVLIQEPRTLLVLDRCGHCCRRRRMDGL